MLQLTRSTCVFWTLLVCPVLFANEFNELDCLIKPEIFVELSSPVDGVLETIDVAKSDFVEKGQEVARLNSSVESARVNLARQRADMDSQIRSKRINLAFTRRKKERFEELYKKKAVSFYEKDQVDTEAALASMELRKSKSDKLTAEMQLQLALAELELRTIKSPIKGVVVERLVMPGESVSDRPILRLAKLDPLKVEVIAPSSLFGQIKKGMRAEITPEAPANSIYKATVNVVDRVIDAASGSFAVQLELPNPDYELIGGLKCTIKVFADSETSDRAKNELEAGPQMANDARSQELGASSATQKFTRK